MHPLFPTEPATRVFALGSSGSGLLFHQHGDAWLEVLILYRTVLHSTVPSDLLQLLAGEKHWFIARPNFTIPLKGANTTVQWYWDVFPTLSVEERAGKSKSSVYSKH